MIKCLRFFFTVLWNFFFLLPLVTAADENLPDYKVTLREDQKKLIGHCAQLLSELFTEYDHDIKKLSRSKNISLDLSTRQ